MDKELKPVQIVTVKDKTTLFRDGEPATNIEMISLEEFGYEVVSQKDLYQIGDTAIYIMPDYCLSDIKLFESFIRPNGNKSKSKLGSKNRIRAVKFNRFYREGKDESCVYSEGILISIQEVNNYVDSLNTSETDMVSLLGITKWEEEEPCNTNNSDTKSEFPEGMYKTDETNINNLWGHLDKIGYPITLVGTQKIDGSSITIYRRDELDYGICSRKLKIDLFSKKHIGKRSKTLLEKIMFWKDPDLNLYELQSNDSNDFIKSGKPYLNKLIEKDKIKIALRGELNGAKMKGSGNKNNPSKNESANIKFFSIDSWNKSNNCFERMNYHAFKSICQELSLPTVPEIFNKEFSSKDEIIQECTNYFKDNLIEGIVLRDLNSTFSAKFMNPEYDSKK